MDRAAARIVRAYERIQVELQGKYSVERVAELSAFLQQHTSSQCIQRLLTTPLPCLLVVVLMDLAPLRAPTDGPAKNGVLWARVFFVAFAIAATLIEQGRKFIRGLPCSTQLLLVMSTITAICATAFGFLLSLVIGFPVPFMAMCCAPVFFVAFVIMGAFQWGQLLRANKKLQYELVVYIKIMVVQFSLTVVYPAYNYVFTGQKGIKQTAVVMALPVLKMTAKNAIGFLFNRSLEDFKPELVILNVEVFHSLFVSCCMQNSTSWTTTVLLMCADFIQAQFSFRDINTRLKVIQSLETKIQTAENESGSTPQASTLTFIEKTLFFVETDEAVDKHASVRHRSGGAHLVTSRIAAIVPLTINLRKDPPSAKLLEHNFRHLYVLTTAERVKYVTTTLSILHITEYLLLIEFVEVVIPVIYCVYLTATSFQHNRIYYPQLAALDSHSLLSTIGSVAGYAALELVSFIWLGIALRRKLKLSPLHQLGFVIHKQRNLVQSKLILWVVFAVHVALEHFGYDYSFRFAWLSEQAT